MIQANDLRIGNWVFFNEDGEWKNQKVNYIGKDCEGYVGYFVHFGWASCTLNDFHDELAVAGIPLTPEILEKCGFIWNEELNGFELSGWLPFHIEKRIIITEWYFLTTFKKDWQICKINYLHQLQNLYYALTNEELQIKL